SALNATAYPSILHLLYPSHHHLHSFPTRRSSDLLLTERQARKLAAALQPRVEPRVVIAMRYWHPLTTEAVTALNGLPLDQLVLRSEEHTSELQSHLNLVCRLLLEKKNDRLVLKFR